MAGGGPVGAVYELGALRALEESVDGLRLHHLDVYVGVSAGAFVAASLANGISRGLAQRVADVALKQRWPLLIGIRETPMSSILLENLLRLAHAGAHIVPPLPAFDLKPD